MEYMCKGKGKIQNKISENLSSMYVSSRDITGLRKTNKNSSMWPSDQKEV